MSSELYLNVIYPTIRLEHIIELEQSLDEAGADRDVFLLIQMKNISSDEVAEALVQLLRMTPRITCLSLEGTHITKFHLEKFFTPGSLLLDSVTSLHVSGVDSFDNIANLKNLSAIHVHGGTISTRAMDSIIGHPGIKKMWWGSTTPDPVRFFERLGDTGVIQELTLADLNPSGIDFARFFRKTIMLQKICVHQCEGDYMLIVRALRNALRMRLVFITAAAPGETWCNVPMEEYMSFVRGHRSLEYFYCPGDRYQQDEVIQRLQRNTCWRSRMLVYLLWCNLLPKDMMRYFAMYLSDE